MPARRAGWVHELQVQKHRHGQRNHRHQHHNGGWVDGEQNQDHHIPTGRKTCKTLVLGFHSRVREINHRPIDDHQNRPKPRPSGQHAIGIQGIGRNKDVGQVIDDQVHQDPVIQRRIGDSVIAARQGPVDAINDQGHDQPQEHHAPLALNRRQHGQHRQDRSCRGEKVNHQGFYAHIHKRLMAEMQPACKRGVENCCAIWVLSDVRAS